MKNFFLIVFLAMITLSLAAQSRPADEKIGGVFTNANIVTDALNKAMAAINGSGTANQIAYFTNTNTVSSLSTATYPSLTEFSYLKGVTSSVQNQLNGKANSTHTHNGLIPTGGTTSQVLVKNSNTNYDFSWKTVTTTTGQDTTGFYNIFMKYFNQMPVSKIKGTAETIDSLITDYRNNNFLRLNK